MEVAKIKEISDLIINISRAIENMEARIKDNQDDHDPFFGYDISFCGCGGSRHDSVMIRDKNFFNDMVGYLKMYRQDLEDQLRELATKV